MATPRKRPEDILPAGRPTKYKPEYDHWVYKYCLLGLDDSEIAVILEINDDTLYEWKKVYPSFSEAFKNGRENAVADVAAALVKRAKGYDYQEEVSTKDGPVLITKHLPPDVAACSIVLRNKTPKRWRNNPEQQQATIPQTPNDIEALKADIRKLVEENGFHS